MSLSPAHPHAPALASLSARRWAGATLGLLLGPAMLLALALRVGPAMTKPLWLDETWTGMMGAQTSLPGLVRQIRDDANAPAYYSLVFLWAKLAGVSNVALRAPNVVLGLAAVAVALLQRRTLGLRTAAVWGLLLAFWWPALDLNYNARCYTLLVLAATLTTVAHVRLLSRPTVGRAFAWVAAGALAFLTHYYSALLLLAEGLVLLVVHRQRALKLWPAALAFLPALAWALYHLPRLEAFAQPGVAWYPPLKPADLFDAVLFIGGGPLAILSTLVLGALVMAAPPGAGARRPKLTSAGWSAMASVLAMGLCLVAAAVRPTYTLRYLTPFAPGVLLGLALLNVRAARSDLLLVVLPLAFGLTSLRMTHAETPFGFEDANAYLERASPRRLEFFWDHPATAVEAPDQLRKVGGFFFARDGHPLPVDPIIPSRGSDPNTLMASRGGRGSALLWFYDLHLRGVAASIHPPTALERDPRWRCRNFGDAVQGVIACRPAP